MKAVSSILWSLMMLVVVPSSYADTVTVKEISTFSGVSNLDTFGTSVSSLGDVNGDGFNDLLIGAPADDSTASNAGAAYLYLGSASGFPTNVPAAASSAKFVGPATTNANFGISVAGIGDINGDGKKDFAIGASQATSDGNQFNGNVYVFFGRSSGFTGTIQASSADLIIRGNDYHQYFGISISPAGDFNKDGYADFLVGTTIFNGPGTPSGQGGAYLFLGKPSFPASITIASADSKIQSLGANNFGIALAGIGDINNDGYSDIAIGAPNKNYTVGRAFVILGRAAPLGSVVTADTVAAYVFDGESAGSYFGSSISGGGDINKDGYSDFVIGASGYSSGGVATRGAAYVFYGGAGSAPLGGGTTLATIPHVKYEGDMAYDNFSQSTSFLGDIDGDGVGDVAITAHGSDDIASNGGKLYVVRGSTSPFASNSTISVASSYSYSGTIAEGSAGNSTSGPVDTNANGSVEVLVGAPVHGNQPGVVKLVELIKTAAPVVQPTPQPTPVVITSVAPVAPRIVNFSSTTILRSVQHKLKKFTLFTVRFRESTTGADRYEFEVRSVGTGTIKSRYLVGSKDITLTRGQWLRSIILPPAVRSTQILGRRVLSGYFYKIDPNSLFQVRVRACNGNGTGAKCSAYSRIKKIP